MPADFGSPVADKIQVPQLNQGLQTLSSLTNLQQQQQQLQLGKQHLQIGESNVQQAQQQMAERQILQKTMASGIDPDGNAIKGDNGEVDPTAMAKFANKHMPLIGQQVQQSIISTLDNRIKLNDSIRGLNQNYRNDISGIVRSGIGSDDPRNVNAALDAYAEQNPDAAQSIERSKSLVNHLGPQLPKAQRDQALQHLAMEFQPSNMTAQEQQPGGPTITGPGGGVQATNTNPRAPYPIGALGPEMRQGVGPSMSLNPMTGQPMTLGSGMPGTGSPQEIQPPIVPGMEILRSGAQQQSQQSQRAPGSATPGWPRLPAFPTPQQAQSAAEATKEADAIRSADSHPVTGYEPTKQVYINLLKLVKENPKGLGPGSSKWNSLTSILTPAGGNMNSSTQEVDAYLSRLAMQNASAAGVSTDAARSMSASAAGSTEMNPEALTEKLRFSAATLEASHAYRQGMDKVVGTGNENPIAKRAFDSAWSQNADIYAFRLLSAKNLGDKEGFQKAMSDIQSLPSAQRATIQKHMHNLNMLSNGQMPQ